MSAQATDEKGAQGVTNVTVNITTLPLLTLDPIGFQANRSFKLLMLGEAGRIISCRHLIILAPPTGRFWG